MFCPTLSVRLARPRLTPSRKGFELVGLPRRVLDSVEVAHDLENTRVRLRHLFRPGRSQREGRLWIDAENLTKHRFGDVAVVLRGEHQGFFRRARKMEVDPVRPTLLQMISHHLSRPVAS